MRRANRTGSVWKASGKRRKPWVARIVTGIDEHGNPIRRTVGTYATKREAEAALLEVTINPDLINRATLQQIWDLWSAAKLPTVSDSTVATYHYAWCKLAPLYNIPVRELRLDVLQPLFDSLSSLSISSAKHVRTLLSQLMDYAIASDFAEKNYTEYIVLKGRKPAEKQTFSRDEVRQILTANTHPHCDVPAILVATGLRIGELADITVENVHMDEGYMIAGKKTEAGKNRVIPIHDVILPRIASRLRSAKKYLMETDDSKKITRDGLRYRYEIGLQEAGVRYLSAHCCRHTYATLLNSSVANKDHIKRLMGHSDYSVTSNIYTHDDIDALVSAGKSLNLL